jgi:type IV pilus assembly protein PilO
MASMSDRDRKLALGIIPVVLIVAYWFLLLAPKKHEASAAAASQAKQEKRLATERAKLDAASSAKGDFRDDYTQIVRLGKAIPAKVDMPSLLVQLDAAARGTGIRFTRIATGERTAASTGPAAGAAPSAPAGTGTPVQAGGEPAQSAPGQAAESANNAQATSNQASNAASQSGVDATTSTTARPGGLPVGGGAPTTTATGATPAVAPPGLETVSLDMEFVGDFFHLADFFHSIKRFVHVVDNNVVVNGRLVTIEGVKYASDPDLFPRLRAEITATVYLSPQAQGATAGATPQGPATTPASTPTTTPTAPSAAPAPPIAAATR